MKYFYIFLLVLAACMQLALSAFGDMFTAQMAVMQLNDSNVDYAMGSRASIVPMVLSYSSIILAGYSFFKLFTLKEKNKDDEKS